VTRGLKVCAAGIFFAVNALAQGAPELNAQFDAIRQSIGQRDFMIAMQQVMAIQKFAIARGRELSPSYEVVKPLNFPAGTGDVSYLLAMVEQNWRRPPIIRLGVRAVRFTMGTSSSAGLRCSWAMQGPRAHVCWQREKHPGQAFLIRSARTWLSPTNC
jgi:hypothetical protein